MDVCLRFQCSLHGGCQSLWRRLLIALSLSIGFVVSQPVMAQNNNGLDSARRSSSSAETADSLDKIFKDGEVLERDGQWADALSLYQTALKKQPNDQTLIQRRSLARIHYDLGRRYGDTSFLNQIKRTAPAQAQNAYAEVLLKIQSYYVDIPDWDRLTRCGLMDLQIALHNEQFREAHLPNLSDARLNEVLAGLAKTLDQTTVRQRTDSVMVANHTAEYLQEHLGLPVSATIYEFVSGAMAALDPYSSYMSESQYGETMSQIEGNFVGLGVELKTHKDRLEIVNVISGGPAGQGGLRPGDNILAIDNVSVSETGSEKAADNLRGPDGSAVILDVQRENQPVQALR